MPTSNRILHYKFQDSIKGVYSIAIMHGLFTAFFLIGPLPEIVFSNRAILCLTITALSAYLLNNYDWRSAENNHLIIGLYALSVVFELIVLGIPQSESKLPQQHIYLTNKGGLTDIIIGLAPAVYLGLRGLFIIPLLVLRSRALKLPT